MPTAPTFSERFYEKFGHDLVTELAEWLNQMDLAYRSQLRDLNELNFARFDALLDKRVGELKAELRQEISETRAELRQDIAETKVVLREEIGQLRADMRAGFAQLENRLTSRLIRWMFVFWTGTTITLLGVMFAITRL